MLVPYNEDWPRLFERERAALEPVLAPWLDEGVHHVGSTAVPGLAAKPVIDMVAGVRNLEEAAAAVVPLSALGYTHAEHRPDALWFRKPAGAEWWEATHALHLTETTSDLWRERLTFRDALRADPELAAEYERWKRSHAARAGDPRPYTDSKTPVVASVLARHGIELKPDAVRLSVATTPRRDSAA